MLLVYSFNKNIDMMMMYILKRILYKLRGSDIIQVMQYIPNAIQGRITI